MPEDPSRSWRQNMNAGKQRPVLQHTPASNEFSKPTRIDGPQFRANLQNSLCFCREVNSILCLVVIHPLQTESVIEKHHRSAPAVDQQTMKPAIQSFGKIRLVFILMHQI